MGDLEWRNGLFCVILQNSVAFTFRAHYIKVVEGIPILPGSEM